MTGVSSEIRFKGAIQSPVLVFASFAFWNAGPATFLSIYDRGIKHP